MKKKIEANLTLVNSISNLLLQFVSIISAFIIPKLTLNTFGSEINGLVMSLTQFLGYINIIEGGITGVITASLYKPIVNNDKEKISSIMVTAKKFYKKISIIFVIYSILLAILYPILFKNNYSYAFTFTLALILMINIFIQFSFSLTSKTILTANKRLYIISLVQILILVLNITLFYIIIRVYPSIHILKLITGLVYIIEPIILNNVVKTTFELDKNAKENKKILESRWDGFAINIASFVHSGTDIAVLTILTDLKIVSVYSIYALVTNGIKKIILSISNAITPTIGNIYAKHNKDILNLKFELYEYIIFMLVYFFFSVGGLLITPFVSIYTNNITDIDYNEPLVGFLLIIAEGVCCLREPYLSLSYSANKFKEIKKPAYIEAIINIILSLALVYKFGLIGVAIGTLVAMIYRTIFHVHYFKSNVIFRSPSHFYKKILLFSICSIIGILICKYFILIDPVGIIDWIICAMLYSAVFITIYMIMSFLFYKENLNYLRKKLIRKRTY